MHHYLDPGTLCGLVGMAVTSKLYDPKTQQMPFCTSVFFVFVVSFSKWLSETSNQIRLVVKESMVQLSYLNFPIEPNLTHYTSSGLSF